MRSDWRAEIKDGVATLFDAQEHQQSQGSD